jgi:hypothetical protein
VPLRLGPILCKYGRHALHLGPDSSECLNILHSKSLQLQDNCATKYLVMKQSLVRCAHPAHYLPAANTNLPYYSCPEYQSGQTLERPLQDKCACTASASAPASCATAVHSAAAAASLQLHLVLRRWGSRALAAAATAGRLHPAKTCILTHSLLRYAPASVVLS